MIGLQPTHIVLIVLVALVLFAPDRLPLVARGMKKMVSEFKKEASGKGEQSKSPRAADD